MKQVKEESKGTRSSQFNGLNEYIEKANTSPGVKVKTDGIKMRGAGAAIKGVISRGPMA